MSTQSVSEEKVSQLQRKLSSEDLLKKSQSSRQSLLTSLSREFDVPIGKIEEILFSTMYEETNKLDNNEEELYNENGENSNVEKRLYTTPPYKNGAILDVVVKRITDFGVMCETLDEHKRFGMIHISNIKNYFITDIHLYFEVGDELKVKYIGHKEGKLALSTKEMKLPLKPTLSTYNYDPSSSENDKQATKQSNEKDVPFEESEKQKERKLLSKDNEVEQIIEFMNSKVGALSPAAKEELFSTLSDTSIFSFTMKMLEVSNDFHPDMGLLFLTQVKEKLQQNKKELA